MPNPITPEEVRQGLSRIGKTTVDLARELGVPVHIVRGVLSRRFKGERGDAHKVAVALGLKDGVIVANDMPIADAIKAAVAH